MADTERPRIPVHVGAEAPRVYAERQAAADEFERSGEPYNREHLLRKPFMADEVQALDAGSFGVEFRWIGDQTDDCVAAIEPGEYSSYGATEFERLCAGAIDRGEPAVVIRTLKTRDRGSSIFGPSAGGSLAGVTSVVAHPVGIGTRPSLVPSAHAADLDLARRVLNAATPKAQWWALSLAGQTWHRGDGSGEQHHPPVGNLEPLLVSNLDEPLMAVWTSPDAALRVYVLPPIHDWSTTLRWLVEQGLPAHAPNTMRALRSEHAEVPQELLSREEAQWLNRLQELAAEYESKRRTALDKLGAARTRAVPIRDALLFEQGRSLETAVGEVFRSAGLDVLDLDTEFGDTISADFLIAGEGVRTLVEVKSSSGPASEDLMSKLEKHYQVWPKLRPDVEVHRGLLVVNHSLRMSPLRRPPQPFQRREFVQAAPHAIIASRQLLDWWLNEDWESIRGLITGTQQPPANFDSQPCEPHLGDGPNRWWRRK